MTKTNRREQLYAAIGPNIRRARTNAVMTQFELAQMLGLTRPSISNIKSGKQRILMDTAC